MQRLRRTRLVRWLGLLALLGQFALAAFHHHDGVAVAQFDDHTLQVTGLAGTCAETEGLACTQAALNHNAPAQRNDKGVEHCDICWSLASAQVFVAPDVVADVIPYLQPLARPEPASLRSLASCPAAAFDARGPPHIVAA